MTMTAHIVLPRLKAPRLRQVSPHVRVAFAPVMRRGSNGFRARVGLPIALALSALLWALIAALIV